MEAKTMRTGWTRQETDTLMERARAAREQGRPLREVFEITATETGRKPNSIRNFYYAQSRDDAGLRRERFTPFAPDEAERLTEQILTARAGGESVRACVMRLAGGDQRLMLRYQNKYRAMLKSRPDIVQDILDRLRAQGLNPPQLMRDSRVPERIRVGSGERRIDDMLTVIDELIETRRSVRASAAALCRPAAEASRGVLRYVREYLARDQQVCTEAADEFCAGLEQRMAALEEALTAIDGEPQE